MEHEHLAVNRRWWDDRAAAHAASPGYAVTSLLADPRRSGRLFLGEGHPVLWSLDEQRNDAITLAYTYFEHVEPLMLDEPGTYVPTEAEFSNNATREWNHGLGEIVTALLDAGLQLTMLVEHDSVPWDALPRRMVEHSGEWSLAEHRDRLPLSYTLQAIEDVKG